MDADDHRLLTPQRRVHKSTDPPRTLTIDAGVALRSLRHLVGPELHARALEQAGAEAGAAFAGTCRADCTPEGAAGACRLPGAPERAGHGAAGVDGLGVAHRPGCGAGFRHR